MQLFFIFLFVVIWWCVESYFDSSNGIVSLILGCSIFGYGIVNLAKWTKVLSATIIAVGLFISLFAIARFIIHEMKQFSR